MLEVVRFRGKELNGKGISGPQGGALRGFYYGIKEDGKGLVTLDGKIPYLLKGRLGKESMEAIISYGGFVGQVKYLTQF